MSGCWVSVYKHQSERTSSEGELTISIYLLFNSCLTWCKCVVIKNISNHIFPCNIAKLDVAKIDSTWACKSDWASFIGLHINSQISTETFWGIETTIIILKVLNPLFFWDNIKNLGALVCSTSVRKEICSRGYTDTSCGNFIITFVICWTVSVGQIGWNTPITFSIIGRNFYCSVYNLAFNFFKQKSCH